MRPTIEPLKNKYLNYLRNNSSIRNSSIEESKQLYSYHGTSIKNPSISMFRGSNPLPEFRQKKSKISFKLIERRREVNSPKSKNSVSYLSNYNNNSIYYSTRKNNSHISAYNSNYINTEAKFNNTIGKFNPREKIKFIPFNEEDRRKTKIILYNRPSKINNEVEKNNCPNVLKKYKFLCNILNSNNRNTTKTVNDSKKCPRQMFYTKPKDYCNNIPKRKLLNMISPKKLFESECFSRFNENKVKIYENPETIIPKEYTKLNQIGSGSFGKIYQVVWKKNNKKYAMKEMHFKLKDNILYLKERVKFIVQFEKVSSCDGLIKIYGDSYNKINNEFFYYEIMELAERDWEKDIRKRYNSSNYYEEKELINILMQLTKALSSLQQHHITHRDIKLQNILIKGNKYKICDFGESRTLNQKGILIQPIRGSELFMSPILFFGLNKKKKQVTHNTYKSDVFSLGMCMLFAAKLNSDCLYDIREITDMNKIRKILNDYLGKMYSSSFIEILITMLEINEKKRPDFIQLEKIIDSYLNIS